MWLDSDPLVKIEVVWPFVPDWNTSRPLINFRTSFTSTAPELTICSLVILILFIFFFETGDVLGVLLIIRPGFLEINFASLSALAAGITYAFYIIYTRKLSFTDSAIVTLLFTGVVGCIFISIIVPFYWTNLDTRQLLLLISLASIGMLGHFLIILSLRLGEASKLAPLGYFEISTNILVGYAFFGDLPDFWIYLGLSLIVFSGIYIFIRENKESKIK